jgi:uncharacterized phage protein gp47/JayE
MTTNVPRPVFSTGGLSIPSESAIVAGLTADFQAAFGGVLNPSPATPQGQLIASLAAIIGATNDLLLDIVNQVDPAVADGRMQDAIARIYYLGRLPANSTTVTAICTGANGTVIPAGSLAMATDGTIYASISPATISAGTATITFQSTETGPIACPAGSLTTIYRVLPGWDTITNPADGVMGRDRETRAQFEARRSASVAINATGILPALRGAVLNVAGVTDTYVTENVTGSTTTIGGVSVLANSLYVCVQGGTDADVARAIWSRKSGGCNYTGSTTVAVQDTSNGYTTPFPSYNVKFQRPTAVPLYLAVSIANTSAVPADALLQIRSAAAAVFAGQDGGERPTIGSIIYALRFVAAIQTLGPWAKVVAIAIGTSASPTGSSVALNINQIATLPSSNVTVSLV